MTDLLTRDEIEARGTATSTDAPVPEWRMALAHLDQTLAAFELMIHALRGAVVALGRTIEREAGSAPSGGGSSAARDPRAIPDHSAQPPATFDD